VTNLAEFFWIHLCSFLIFFTLLTMSMQGKSGGKDIIAVLPDMVGHLPTPLVRIAWSAMPQNLVSDPLALIYGDD
jgi:hypothetical protein